MVHGSMASPHRAARIGLLVLAPTTALVACTFVNGFDDVKPLTAKDTGTITDSVVTETDLDTGTVVTDSGVDTPVDTGPVDRGLVVVSGQIAGDAGPGQPVLTVLDPADGKRLGTDEKITVVAVKYDGAHDRWYLWINKSGTSFDPVSTTEIELQIRTYDRTKSTWTTLSTLKVPTIVDEATSTVLKDRLAYVSYTTATTFELTVIDTTTATAPKVISPGLALTVPPIGVIGTPAPTGGGTVNMLSVTSGTGCTGGVCKVAFQRATVPAAPNPATSSGTKQVADTLDIAAGQPAWGSFYNGGSPQDLLMVPPTGAATKATLIRLSPISNDPVTGTTPVAFTVAKNTLRSLTVSECLKTAFVTDLNGTQVYGVPLAFDGTPNVFGLGRSGQRLYFEPYTHTVLAPYRASAAAFEIAALEVTGTDKAPVFKKRGGSSWSPPAELQPTLLAVKAPNDFPCP